MAGNIINKTVRYHDHNSKRFLDFDLAVGNPAKFILTDTMGPTDKCTAGIVLTLTAYHRAPWRQICVFGDMLPER